MIFIAGLHKCSYMVNLHLPVVQGLYSVILSVFLVCFQQQDQSVIARFVFLCMHVDLLVLAYQHVSEQNWHDDDE